MKVYETKVVPASTRQELVCRSCDLCGAKSKHFNKWEGDCYAESKTEIEISISQREGTVYPEGGSGTEYEIDLCPNCFKNRLVVWLKEQGATIEEKDWAW